MAAYSIPKRAEGENNRQYATRVLLQNIMTLRMEPGAVINEAEWSALLGTSRTPVREAILRLKEYHLVDVYPQKASVVRRINLDLVNEGYFLRSEVEPLVLAEACGNIGGATATALAENLARQKSVVDAGDVHAFFALDNEFHRAIYEGVRKKHIWQAIGSVSSHFERIRHFDALRADMNIALFYEEHQALYAALLTGDGAALATMYPGHLAFYQASLPALLQQYPSYFESEKG